MTKSFTLIQTVATAGLFSAVSFWYGFMFGRETSRKELGDLIADLRRSNPDQSSTTPPHSLLNALDPQAGGAMVEAIQADNNPTWLDQIQGRFLHPTDQSLSQYAAEVLGLGEVRRGSDPDDAATLSEHMRKKALDDHKRHLDEQAAALLAAKRAKLQKEVPPAPSESEVDLGVFSGGRGNLLEELYATSASRPGML
ncbi:hypothetical protein Hanom_Chr04g00314941 [Helianthus anomalus]